MATPVNFDEIVFRSRNHEYGAYDLRKKIVRYTMIALLIGVLTFSLGLTAPWAIQNFGKKAAIVDDPSKKKQNIDEIITEIELENLEEKTIEHKPVEIKEPPKKAQVRYQPPKQVDDDEVVEEPDLKLDVKDLDDVEVGTKNVEGEKGGDLFSAPPPPPPKPTAVTEVEKDPEPFQAFTGEEPQPVNLDDIKALIGYPQVAQEAGIQGKVIVRVLVDKNGKYEKHIVMNQGKVHDLLVAAVEKQLPKLAFTPGTQAGKPVKVWVTIPFNFKIK
jgi:protein TonB